MFDLPQARRLSPLSLLVLAACGGGGSDDSDSTGGSGNGTAGGGDTIGDGGTGTDTPSTGGGSTGGSTPVVSDGDTPGGGTSTPVTGGGDTTDTGGGGSTGGGDTTDTGGGSSTDTGGSTAVPLSAGVAVKGLLQNALVFVDANENGQLDDGEASTTTDRSGRFSLENPGGNTVIVQTTATTTDVASGAALPGVTLTAGADASVVSPFTTAIEAGVDADQLATALGLDGFDLETFNPFDENIDPADALAAEKVSQQIVNIASIVAAQETAGDADPATQQAAFEAAFAELAGEIALAAAAGEVVDLASEDFLGRVVDDADAVEVIAAVNTSINDVETLDSPEARSTFAVGADVAAAVAASDNGAADLNIDDIIADAVNPAKIELSVKAGVQDVLSDFGAAFDATATEVDDAVAAINTAIADTGGMGGAATVSFDGQTVTIAYAGGLTLVATAATASPDTIETAFAPFAGNNFDAISLEGGFSSLTVLDPTGAEVVTFDVDSTDGEGSLRLTFDQASADDVGVLSMTGQFNNQIGDLVDMFVGTFDVPGLLINAEVLNTQGYELIDELNETDEQLQSLEQSVQDQAESIGYSISNLQWMQSNLRYTEQNVAREQAQLEVDIAAANLGIARAEELRAQAAEEQPTLDAAIADRDELLQTREDLDAQIAQLYQEADDLDSQASEIRESAWTLEDAAFMAEDNGDQAAAQELYDQAAALFAEANGLESLAMGSRDATASLSMERDDADFAVYDANDTISQIQSTIDNLIWEAEYLESDAQYVLENQSQREESIASDLSYASSLAQDIAEVEAERAAAEASVSAEIASATGTLPDLFAIGAQGIAADFELGLLESRLNNLEQASADLSDQISYAQDDLSYSQSNLDYQTGRIAEIDANIATQESAIAQAQAELPQAQEDVVAAQAAYDAAVAEYDAIGAQRDALYEAAVEQQENANAFEQALFDAADAFSQNGLEPVQSLQNEAASHFADAQYFFSLAESNAQDAADATAIANDPNLPAEDRPAYLEQASASADLAAQNTALAEEQMALGSAALDLIPASAAAEEEYNAFVTETQTARDAAYDLASEYQNEADALEAAYWDAESDTYPLQNDVYTAENVVADLEWVISQSQDSIGYLQDEKSMVEAQIAQDTPYLTAQLESIAALEAELAGIESAADAMQASIDALNEEIAALESANTAEQLSILQTAEGLIAQSEADLAEITDPTAAQLLTDAFAGRAAALELARAVENAETTEDDIRDAGYQIVNDMYQVSFDQFETQYEIRDVERQIEQAEAQIGYQETELPNRLAELEAAQTQLAGYEANLASAEAEIASYQAIIDEALAQEAELRPVADALEAQLNAQQALIEEAYEGYLAASNDASEFNDAAWAAQAGESTATVQLDVLNTQRNALEAKLAVVLVEGGDTSAIEAQLADVDAARDAVQAELDAYATQISTLFAQAEDASSEAEAFLAQESELQSELYLLQDEFSAARQAADAAADTAREAGYSIDDLMMNLEFYEYDLEYAQNNVTWATASLAGVESEIAHLEANIAQLEESLQDLQAELPVYDQDLEDLRSSIADLTADARIEGDELMDLRLDKVALELQSDLAQFDANVAQNAVYLMENQAFELENDLSNSTYNEQYLRESVADYEAQIASDQAELVTRQADLAMAQEAVAAAELLVATKSEELDDLYDQSSAAYNEYEGLSSEASSLSNQAEQKLEAADMAESDGDLVGAAALREEADALFASSQEQNDLASAALDNYYDLESQIETAQSALWEAQDAVMFAQDEFGSIESDVNYLTENIQNSEFYITDSLAQADALLPVIAEQTAALAELNQDVQDLYDEVEAFNALADDLYAQSRDVDALGDELRGALNNEVRDLQETALDQIDEATEILNSIGSGDDLIARDLNGSIDSVSVGSLAADGTSDDDAFASITSSDDELFVSLDDGSILLDVDGVSPTLGDALDLIVDIANIDAIYDYYDLGWVAEEAQEDSTESITLSVVEGDEVIDFLSIDFNDTEGFIEAVENDGLLDGNANIQVSTNESGADVVVGGDNDFEMIFDGFELDESHTGFA